MARAKRIAAFILVAAVLGYAGFRYWRTKNVSAVQRGWGVAERTGCFTCHGAGGFRGMPDPGHGLDEVPNWAPGQMMMYAKDEAELREWILDGLPQSVRNDPEQMKLRKNAVILMPAWRDILSEQEVSDVVAYVKAVSDFEKPKDEKAEAGLKTASDMGCFNCHGPQGRGSMPNVRAFKGYIPSWDGADFPELARDDGEIREWILDGGTKRFRENVIASFFIERQPIKMPKYRGHLTDAEVDRIVDYIHWVRQHPY